VSAPITTTLKRPSNIVVATFTHAAGVEPASAFAATINWGDGKTSTGTITLSGTTYSVIGSHRYASGGTHTITTTVTEIGSHTQLLLAKIGDEIPGLPDRKPTGDDGGRGSPSTEIRELANLIGALLGHSDPTSGSSSGSATGPIAPAVLDGLLASIQKQAHAHDELASLGNHSVAGQFDSGILDLISVMDDLFFDPSGGK
jgi:hypothetical protein